MHGAEPKVADLGWIVSGRVIHKGHRFRRESGT